MSAQNLMRRISRVAILTVAAGLTAPAWVTPSLSQNMQGTPTAPGEAPTRWTAERLAELGSQPSVLNPLWYAGSYVLGSIAAKLGDPQSLGFVVETERQVEAHLEEHLRTLPEADQRSRAILQVMKEDEARHADHTEQSGARVLPQPIPTVMAGMSKLMKAVAYRV